MPCLKQGSRRLVCFPTVLQRTFRRLTRRQQQSPAVFPSREGEAKLTLFSVPPGCARLFFFIFFGPLPGPPNKAAFRVFPEIFRYVPQRFRNRFPFGSAKVERFFDSAKLFFAFFPA